MFGPLLESLSRCQLGVRHSPRVTIVVRRPPRVAIDGSNRGRRPPRVATRRRPATCAELACWVRRPPRVTIVVRRRPRVTTVVRRPPRVAIAGSNRGFSRLGWFAQPTVQTGGSPRDQDPAGHCRCGPSSSCDTRRVPNPTITTRGGGRPQHASSEQVGGRPHSRRSPEGLAPRQ